MDALDMLVHDIRCMDPKEMRLEVLRRRAEFFKETKRGKMEMCKIAEELMEKGREEGALATLVSLVKRGVLSIADAAKEMKVSEEAFKKMAML